VYDSSERGIRKWLRDSVMYLRPPALFVVVFFASLHARRQERIVVQLGQAAALG
jgi:hypothetical protein